MMMVYEVFWLYLTACLGGANDLDEVFGAMGAAEAIEMGLVILALVLPMYALLVLAACWGWVAANRRGGGSVKGA
ncbi:MAG: hypothetical protein HQL41_18870 [Alphaproteobacteria bacterium]|nr:hypothetical protein [Alphaproteobacteria bacterium]